MGLLCAQHRCEKILLSNIEKTYFEKIEKYCCPTF
jgi:hypothetical protein